MNESCTNVIKQYGFVVGVRNWNGQQTSLWALADTHQGLSLRHGEGLDDQSKSNQILCFGYDWHSAEPETKHTGDQSKCQKSTQEVPENGQ